VRADGADYVMERGDGLRVDGAAERVFAGIVAALRSARLEARLSQEALAEGLPVRGRAVSEWELETMKPKLGHLFHWTFGLGLRLVIVGRDGGVREVPVARRPGESWERFELRRLALPLRHRRQALGLGLDDVGQLVGVSRSSVQRWELARVPPRPMALVVWAHKLGFSVAVQPIGRS
jgi:transcriptional regulator with XRE-family HTH domain